MLGVALGKNIYHYPLQAKTKMKISAVE